MNQWYKTKNVVASLFISQLLQCNLTALQYPFLHDSLLYVYYNHRVHKTGSL